MCELFLILIVNSLGLLQPAKGKDLLGKPICQMIQNGVLTEYVGEELLVKVRTGTSASGLDTLCARLNIARAKPVDLHRWTKVTFDSTLSVFSVMDSLRASPLIEHVELNRILRAQAVPNDPRFGEQWALRNTGQNGGLPEMDINADSAWDIETGNSSFLLCILDSGIPLDSARDKQ